MEAKGLIFDYGGTLDTHSVHWSEVLWNGYAAAGIDVEKSDFRTAYVHGERTLDREPRIAPEDTMLQVLQKKVDIETRFLVENACWKASEGERTKKAMEVAQWCYAHATQVVGESRKVVSKLAERYPLTLVSNFYGNISAVVKDFELDYFKTIIESAQVGIRKPDPRLFQLGVEALGLKATEAVVIGDSYAKDIVPAHELGCQTIWLRGKGWEEEKVDESLPTAILHHVNELLDIL